MEKSERGLVGVSAVIGVILIVAIIVVIVATVYIYVGGTSTTDLGRSSTITMNIFDRNVNTQTVIWMVTQIEGESIEADEYQWSLLDTSDVNVSGATLAFADNPIDNYINAGDTFTVVASENGYFVFMLTDTATGQTIYKSSSVKY